VPRSVRYLAVASELRRGLLAGEYSDGGLLPSEAELAHAHAVSRVTVRKALSQLKVEGLIDSRQGFGWFVVGRPFQQTLETLTTLESQIESSGRSWARRIRGFAFIDATERVEAVLRTSTVLEVTRVNLIDDTPFARVTVWVPGDLAAPLSRRAVEQRPLYELLEAELAEATRIISATGASAEDAQLLQVPPGAPLLSCERTTVDVAGRAVLLSQAVYNPLKIEFVAKLAAAVSEEPPGELRLVA
jgi:GntR family transcriptional regulator